MPRIAAGLLMYRHHQGQLQVLLVHPGGPYYQRKDLGAWTLPKGEPDPTEPHTTPADLLAIAQREFTEETGLTPTGPYLELKPIRQKGGKQVHAWAFQGNCTPADCHSNTFALEWPPKSGQLVDYPEADRAEWFDLETAREKMKDSQWALVEELAGLMGK